MKITEKRTERDIETYIKQMRKLTKGKGGKVKLGNPNDKHLRMYIKNICQIKLLFPETLDIELTHDKKEAERFINNYKNNKGRVVKGAVKRLNRAKEFVILR